MRAVKLVTMFIVAVVATLSLLIGTPNPASADSTHICQGSRNCNDNDVGGGHGGGHGHGHGKGDNNNELECSNESGDSLITILANVCPQDFPILIDIL
jgi:hypothetical protein